MTFRAPKYYVLPLNISFKMLLWRHKRCFAIKLENRFPNIMFKDIKGSDSDSIQQRIEFYRALVCDCVQVVLSCCKHIDFHLIFMNNHKGNTTLSLLHMPCSILIHAILTCFISSITCTRATTLFELSTVFLIIIYGRSVIPCVRKNRIKQQIICEK